MILIKCLIKYGPCSKGMVLICVAIGHNGTQNSALAYCTTVCFEVRANVWLDGLLGTELER
jgi:hypothetical protein